MFEIHVECLSSCIGNIGSIGHVIVVVICRCTIDHCISVGLAPARELVAIGAFLILFIEDGKDIGVVAVGRLGINDGECDTCEQPTGWVDLVHSAFTLVVTFDIHKVITNVLRIDKSHVFIGDSSILTVYNAVICVSILFSCLLVTEGFGKRSSIHLYNEIGTAFPSLTDVQKNLLLGEDMAHSDLVLPTISIENTDALTVLELVGDWIGQGVQEGITHVSTSPVCLGISREANVAVSNLFYLNTILVVGSNFR